MNIEFEINNKKRAAVIVICMAVGLTVIFDDIFSSKETNSSSINENKTIAENKPVSKTNSDKENGFADITINKEIIEKNPFIELSAVAPVGQQNNQTAQKNIPAIPKASQYGAIPLPNIPAMPLPNVAPMPTIIPNGNQNSAKPEKVKGIIVSEDGTSVAIMGNNQIVTEGETFNDNRITYIGDDGITFDDGHKISYK